VRLLPLSDVRRLLDLTEGGARVWAICLGCADRRGRKLSGAWRDLLLWLAAIFVGLAIVTWILGRLLG
jgi:hypothetical protein